MHVVNISGLKNNPSEALRAARDDVVVVMNRDRPDAVMIGLQAGNLLAEGGARAALATALFRDGGLSLARAARLAQTPLATFIAHLSRLGVSVIEQREDEVRGDIETLDAWLATARA
jgi:predicted HTH domain antitoxin